MELGTVFNSSKDHPNAGAPRLQVHRSLSSPKANFLGWGGLPMCSAFDGLGRAERDKEGKEAEVMKLSFVAAFVAEEGISLEMAVGGRPESWIITPVNMTCSELLPLSDCFKEGSPLGPDVLSTFCDKSRFAAWRKSPSSYLVCEDDQAIPVQAQDGIITREKELGAKIETERLLVSHSTYIVKPECV
ncbi:hypothetical protein BGZ57DRAFT_848988 [Hyaloscypha finlandica]|nr:hypothetical protein BGZ57DRAFT_848988 [Hyaloscypha finlandica]